MIEMKTRTVDCDVLIVGGGMAGCGAAYEARYWGHNLNIVLVEKANIERSGAVAQGLSAINTYLGMRWNENTPEAFVKYARGDLMGLVREDLVYDIARHVDSSVHLFEQWGLPIFKNPENGHYLREGKWQVLIHGESYKPIVAEAAEKSATAVYNRIMVTHIITDAKNPNRAAGAVGFDVRDGTFYVFRAKAVVVAAGGATHVYRPRSVGEAGGRTWYSPWSTGSAFALLIPVGAEMSMMEARLVVTRFKDGYGPVGASFLLLKAFATNAYGESYETKYQGEQRELYGKYVDSKPFPTCLRNDAMIREMKAGKGPILMHLEKSLDNPENEEKAWEDFLDMTISQAIVWASQNIDPKYNTSELTASEPYIMGSHATCAGAWASGPEDIAPKEYNWGYNRMTTVEGLFGAGDTIGACPHKFSSGSFTEGRMAAKSAVRFVLDRKDSPPEVDPTQVEKLKAKVYAPLETYHTYKNLVVKGTVNPAYFYANQAQFRLEKIMEEYGGGWSTYYTTNEPLLKRGLELLLTLKEDADHLAAENLHQLQRAWELQHRIWTAEAVLRHTMFRQETRWPGYIYRSDHPKLDDENWHVFVNSRYDPKTGEWATFKRPILKVLAD